SDPPTRRFCTRSPMRSATAAVASGRCAGCGSRGSTRPRGSRGCLTTSRCTAFARPEWRSTARCWLTWPCATAVPLLGWWRLLRRPSDQLISSPDNEVVRRLRRLAHRREPGFVLLEGPRVLAEAKAAGLEFDLIAVREGDKLPFHTESRVTLTAAAFRAATQTVTPQGVIAIARVHEATLAEEIQAVRDARWS